MSAVSVGTASGAVELSESSSAELVKRLGALDTTRSTAEAFEGAAAEAVELDDAGKRCVLDVLTYWLDSAGPKAFPDDARQLFRALAGEVTR